MSGNPTDKDDAGEKPPAVSLDRTVQDHLGLKLRAVYAEAAEKPAYLGDPALPPEFEHRLLEIEKSAELHEKGVEAVRDALGIPEPARDKGLEAVRDALGIPEPPVPAEE